MIKTLLKELKAKTYLFQNEYNVDELLTVWRTNNDFLKDFRLNKYTDNRFY